MSIHLGHTKSKEWWVIDHNGRIIDGPFKTKATARISLQRRLLRKDGCYR